MFSAENSCANPYTDLEIWVDFTHEDGTTLRRPAFWDGRTDWKVRFAAPGLFGRWRWEAASRPHDPGIAGKSGALYVDPPRTDGSPNRFCEHGFWRLSAGRRSLIHADGYPAVLVGDTAWSLPWRATPDQARVYAGDRAAKGFNAVLLMSVQPDRDARGPRDRTADEGFDVGFEDLSSGHLNELNPHFFRALDELVAILVSHQIVPVWQPVFFGFGWKGKRVAGPVIPPTEYARYCRYLVARYGARPAVWLVGGDGSGYEPQVGAGGREIEQWDAYEHPTGIHYRPHADNRAHQDADWLDFQWCQTGHGGEHMPDRVADMRRNTPIKALANGEPTYENGGKTGQAAGWWQGHEAWSNFTAGGTMGVVYGAGSLWQWRLHPDEPGHAEGLLALGCGWREALDFEGSHYVGLVAKILEGIPLTDAESDWEVVIARRGVLVAGRLYLAYLGNGGGIHVVSPDVPLPYVVIDPMTGEELLRGERSNDDPMIPDTGEGPRVVICRAP